MAVSTTVFADWQPYRAGDAEFGGTQIGVVLVEQSTTRGSGKIVFSSFPEGVNCSSTLNSAWIRPGSISEENRLMVMALMARSLNRPVNAWIRIVDGDVCELMTLQF